MPARKRVLHIITRMIRGGADENTLLTLSGLSRDRYHSDLAAGPESELDAYEFPSGTEIHRVSHLVREVAPLKDLAALFELARIIRAGHYDIVHTHTAKAGVVGRFAAALNGTPVVIHTLHGATFHPNVAPWVRRVYVGIERLAARATSRFVSVSNDVGERYVAAGVIQPAGFDTVYSGMDVRRFAAARSTSVDDRMQRRAELGVPSDAQLVGVVARLEPRKGHHFLFEAIARLAAANPRLHLLVVGDGDRREELEVLGRELGIAKRITFTGHRHDVDRVLAALDICALTSLWEGLPRCLVQAALVSVPILSFDVEGVRELVNDGRNGYVVPIADVERLTERLQTMLESLDDLRGECMARVTDVEQRWSDTAMLEAIETIYERELEAA